MTLESYSTDQTARGHLRGTADYSAASGRGNQLALAWSSVPVAPVLGGAGDSGVYGTKRCVAATAKPEGERLTVGWEASSVPQLSP